MITPLRSALAAGLALFLLWLPLPYGSVTPGSLLIVRLAAAIGLLVALMLRQDSEVFRAFRIAFMGLAGLALLALAQSLTWPRWAAAIASPRHLELARQAVDEGLATDSAGVRLSLAPSASASLAVTIVALAAFLAVGFVAGRHSLHRRWLAAAILMSAVAQVLVGLRPWLAGQVPRVTGTFVNPDHLAVYLEISLCVGLAAIWSIAHRTRDTLRPDVRILAVGGAVLMWIFLFSGLLFTGSRAGLLSALVGLSVGGVLLAAAWRKPRRALVAAAAGLALAAGVAILSGSRGLYRLLGTSWYDVFANDRAQVWREAAPLLADFPWLGTGLGSFEEAFPLVQSTVSTRVLWGRAHNDYLELALTGGLLGVAFGGLVLLGIARPLLRVVRRGLRTEDRLSGVAALSALAAVGTHELFDFGLSLPANAATLTLLVGAAAASRLAKVR